MQTLLHNLGVIILAAGRGARIGQEKWKLQMAGKTFLTHIVDKLVGVGLKNIVCVLRPAAVPNDRRIVWVINSRPERGMFSSIYCGVQRYPKAVGYMIFPVDHPFVTEETLYTLCNTFRGNRAKVVCPTFKQRVGHPIIIPQQVAQQITFTDYQGGLARFLLEQGLEFCKVAVTDKNILRNINTRADIEFENIGNN